MWVGEWRGGVCGWVDVCVRSSGENERDRKTWCGFYVGVKEPLGSSVYLH